METASVDISKALAIDGWMTEQELIWLAEQAREHSVIVEIGSFLGRSTRAMLDHTNGIVYAIDDWKGPRDVYLSKEERNSLFEKFLCNVEGKSVAAIKCSHDIPQKTMEWICLTPPDMVFIDGEHTYDAVKRDIELWLPKIKSGGLICGHDIDQPDVQKAVTETLGDADIADNTTIWYKFYYRM